MNAVFQNLSLEALWKAYILKATTPLINTQPRDASTGNAKCCSLTIGLELVRTMAKLHYTMLLMILEERGIVV
jgi:hypothetical protein